MKFVRIFNTDLIPKDLVEDNHDRNYSTDHFYKIMRNALITPEGNVVNTEILHVIIEEINNTIIGYLWYSINLLEEEIFINTISVNKENRDNGKLLNKIFQELKESFKGSPFKTVRTCSTRTEWHKKNGFVESKNILLEYDLTEVKKDG